MKINVRSNANMRKSRHDLTHRVNTTSNFGLCQPIMARELSPDCTVKYRVGQACYLNPMSKPTFGRCMIKTYHSWVPYADVWHPFESFLAGQTYRGSDAHYIPTSVPTMRMSLLNVWLKVHSEIYCWLMTNSQVTSSDIRYDSLTPYDTTTVKGAILTNWRNATGVGLNIVNSTVLDARAIYVAAADNNKTVSAMDWLDVMPYGSDTILVGGIYSGYARDLRKIFIGCGWQINNSTDDKSLLSVLSFYKAYFDLFNPQRDITWKDTYTYGLLEYMEQHNMSAFSSWAQDTIVGSLWINCMDEIADSYYTQNPDYVSAHITGTHLPIASGNDQMDYVDPYGTGLSMTANSTHQASIDTAYTTHIGQAALNILRKLSERINAHTAMGGKIKEYLRSVYGSDYRDEKESNFVGSQITEIDISEVMNQAETSEGFVGEFAARGIGKNPGQVYSYTTHDFGCFISMMAIVPDARYCQAVDPLLNHTTRRSFFDASFDSITLLPTPKYNIYGVQEIMTNQSDSGTLYNGGFGNIPNYMEYKVAYDVCNGEMSQRSKRSSYLPYTLNKILPYSNNSGLSNLSANVIVNGTLWRYIGKSPWVGNFNRIFTNDDANLYPLGRTTTEKGQKYRYGFSDDNFIVHCYLDFQVYAPWKPVADSFDTGGEDQSHLSVEKA